MSGSCLLPILKIVQVPPVGHEFFAGFQDRAEVRTHMGHVVMFLGCHNCHIDYETIGPLEECVLQFVTWLNQAELSEKLESFGGCLPIGVLLCSWITEGNQLVEINIFPINFVILSTRRLWRTGRPAPMKTCLDGFCLLR